MYHYCFLTCLILYNLYVPTNSGSKIFSAAYSDNEIFLSMWGTHSSIPYSFLMLRLLPIILDLVALKFNRSTIRQELIEYRHQK